MTEDELAGGPIDDTDVRILASVAAMFDRLDPVPAGLVDRVRFGITLDALNAEIAELERSGELAGVRADEITGAAEANTVTFTASSLTAMITITAIGERARLDGWVVPGGGVTVELRVMDERRSVTVDADGRFAFDDVPHGFAQLLLTPPPGAGSVVVTPSIEI